jgi:phosphonate transport system substrate-binding protein
MDKLRITTCLSSNTDDIGRAIAVKATTHLGLAAEFVDDLPWQEREQLLDDGRIQVGWMCGLLYTWKSQQENNQLALLAAPVMKGARYQGQPVYFSDIIVRGDSPYFTFDDLHGASWTYNEERSYSGYLVLFHHLTKLNRSVNFLGPASASGSHLNSIQLVLEGRAEAAAIDSTILDCELHRRPELSSQIRVVETLGPSPSPPLIVSRRLPAGIREDLLGLVLGMHQDPDCRAIMASSCLERFELAIDKDYDLIRQVAHSVTTENPGLNG